MTVPDRYPLPNVAYFTSHFNNCTVFTKLDLTKGYYHGPMAKGDIPMMVVITPLALFKVPTLVHPDTSAKVSFSVDAPSPHIGAVLQ
jgi:hypothetical protein